MSISRNLTYLLLVFGLLGSCQNKQPEPIQNISIQTIDTLYIPGSSRAIQALSADEVWFAGSNGLFGHTQNGGKDWRIDSIRTDSLVPHFRSIAVTEKAVHLLSIASPALLYRSIDQGETWEIAYQEDHPAAFYDAMQFWDNQYGIAMGDPTDGCLSVIRTENGGQSWEKVPCTNLPPAIEGEAAFAASNTNLAVQPGGKVWMVSGGQAARVFYSEDYGKNWQVFDTPIISQGQMTGIYSVDFLDAQNGIIFGGDWNDKTKSTQNKAITQDGGQTWQLISDGQLPGYQSCVKYLPEQRKNVLLSCGIPGLHYTLDGGQNWTKLSSESYYALSFGDEHTIWLAGNGKIAKVEF
jgi:photosystem II stability/assembly factor-like uncharacterized protein